MKKALFRIVKAIKLKEKILVFDDYDDGITETAILVKSLRYFRADAAYRLSLYQALFIKML